MSCTFQHPTKVHFANFLAALISLASLLSGQQSQAPTSVDLLFQSGRASLLQGKYQEAEEAFRKVSELEPATSRGILGVADVYVARKDDDEALRLLQAASSERPTRLDLHFGIGNVALHAAKYDLAIAEFQLVLDSIDKTSPTAGDLYLRLADAYRLKGDVDFSIDVFRQAQKLQPGNATISNALAFVLQAAGQRKAAAEEYRRILEADPHNGLVMNNLAFLLADDGGDLNMALAYAYHARQLFPNEPTVADTLGWVYLKMNRVEDAITLFRQIVEKDPGRAAYHYHFAAALDQQGDRAAALKELGLALKNNPSKEDEQKIKELTQKIGR